MLTSTCTIAAAWLPSLQSQAVHGVCKYFVNMIALWSIFAKPTRAYQDTLNQIWRSQEHSFEKACGPLQHLTPGIESKD